MKKQILFLLFLVISTFTQAQKQKIGYVYEDYILQNLPAIKSLQEEVKTRKEQLQGQLQEKIKDYQEKYSDYQQALKDVSNLTTELLNAKLKTVQVLQDSVKTFQKNGEIELQRIINEKFSVIQEKMREQEKVVAKEKGYPFVFRRNSEPDRGENFPVLIYASDLGKDNLSNAVLLKFGVTMPVKTETPAAVTPKKAAPTKKATPPKK